MGSAGITAISPLSCGGSTSRPSGHRWNAGPTGIPSLMSLPIPAVSKGASWEREQRPQAARHQPTSVLGTSGAAASPGSPYSPAGARGGAEASPGEGAHLQRGHLTLPSTVAPRGLPGRALSRRCWEPFPCAHVVASQPSQPSVSWLKCHFCGGHSADTDPWASAAASRRWHPQGGSFPLVPPALAIPASQVCVCEGDQALSLPLGSHPTPQCSHISGAFSPSERRGSMPPRGPAGGGDASWCPLLHVRGMEDQAWVPGLRPRDLEIKEAETRPPPGMRTCSGRACRGVSTAPFNEGANCPHGEAPCAQRCLHAPTLPPRC